MKRFVFAFISFLLIAAFPLCLASCFEEKEAQSTASVTESASADDGSAAVGTETEVTETEADTAAESAADTSPESHTETETDAETQTDTELSESESTSGDTVPDPPEELYVCYADFGAAGDGETDDFDALSAAHAYANENGLPVKATAGAVYLIAEKSVGRQIEIKTDTDWTGARFIIDDRCVAVDDGRDYQKPIFRIAPSVEGRSVKSVTSAKKGAASLGFSPGEKCLAVIENKYSKVYIRTGVHAGSGETNKEILLLDEDGNISESTPLNFDYNSVTALTLYHIDDTVLTVRGGEFHTITNTQPHRFTYFYRSISVERSNTVVENVTHTLEGETDEGAAPYNGFIFIRRCMNVTVKDCVFTPHYIFGDFDPVESNTFGYDIHVNTATDVLFTGCTQTISIDDTDYWGVFTSNFSRNITLDNCVLSRFDAHRGVYNVTIKDCVLGHQGIRLVGFGLMTVENTTVRSGQFIQLRADYGSSFDGKIVIKNCRYEPQSQLWSKSELIYARNDCDHYYGYKCYFPEIEIDGLKIIDKNATTEYKGIYILPAYTDTGNQTTSVDNFKYHTAKNVTLKNIVTASGLPYIVCRIPGLYPGLKVNGKTYSSTPK